MSTIPRETWLGAVFVSLADADAPGTTAIDALHVLALAAQTIDGVTEAGVILADAHGALEVMATSSVRADMLEVLQLAEGQGPCVDCYRAGEIVRVDDLAGTGESWPVFQRSATVLGIRSVLSVPLRLRGETIGAMNLFSARVAAISDHDVALAQALADVATIGILQSRASEKSVELQTQLKSALESRVLIEQAKGVISGAREITVEEAFTRLRDHARSNNMRLLETARLVVIRELVL